MKDNKFVCGDTLAFSLHFQSKINTNKDQELVLVTTFDKSSATYELCPVINVQPVRPKNPTMLSRYIFNQR